MKFTKFQKRLNKKIINEIIEKGPRKARCINGYFLTLEEAIDIAKGMSKYNKNFILTSVLYLPCAGQLKQIIVSDTSYITFANLFLEKLEKNNII